MQSVNIHENRETQRKIIKEFILKVKEKPFFNNDDFEEVFNFFSQIVNLECLASNIEVKTEKLDSGNLEAIPRIKASLFPRNIWRNRTLAEAGGIDLKTNNITLYVDPVLFCRMFFGANRENQRLEGVVELLVTIYHEIDHALKQQGMLGSYLSPEILEASREAAVGNLLDDEFYENNYKLFSAERFADEYAYDTILDMIADHDTLKIAQEKVKEFQNKAFSESKIGKIKIDGKTYNKEKWFIDACGKTIESNPRSLYEFPIFSKQYNENGTPKDIHEIFEEMTIDLKKIIHRYSFLDPEHKLASTLEQEYFDCQMFYYELLLPLLSTATEEDYKKLAEKYSVTVLQNLLSGMEKYANNKSQPKLECAEKYSGDQYESIDEIKEDLMKKVNSITRFRNGATFNKIAEELLRNGGFIRGTREILPELLLKRREVFANSLIGVYDAIESEEEYVKRAESEKSDIDEVVKALYFNRFENLLNNVEIEERTETEFRRAEVVRTAQVLKMVRLLSDETKLDYFTEFLTIPDVNRILAELESDKGGYLKNSIQRAQIRIKKVKYPLTEAENGKYSAYILGEEDSVDSREIKKKLDMLNEEMKNKKPKRNRGFNR